MDNFEHLLPDGAERVLTLLEQVTVLTVLVTSRQRLDLPGEQEIPVPSLPVPTRDIGSDVSPLLQYPSVQLFVDRAQSVRPDFQVTSSNAASVAALCARLEGLPLAIELAAARVGVLTAAEILARLESPLELLVRRTRGTDSRHRSLRATLDWSYRLLPPELQQFFARLSVFRGGWTLAAAEAVCEQSQALDGLEQLRACSLVLAEEQADAMRFRMLETIREFALERLAAGGEGETLRRRHAEYFVALAAKAVPALRGREQGLWMDHLERERDNLRAALDWSLESGEAEAGLRLGTALAPFWEMRGFLTEGRSRLGALLSSPVAADTSARAKALSAAGILACRQGDYEVARVLHEESLTLKGRLGDRTGTANSLNDLAYVADEQGDWPAARARLEEALALSREQGDRQSIARSLSNLGFVMRRQDEYAAARVLLEEALALNSEAGDLWGIATAKGNLGNLALQQGDCVTARSLFEEGMAIGRELDNRRIIVDTLVSLGLVAWKERDVLRARAVYAESLAMRRETGDKPGIADCLDGLAWAAAMQEQPARAARLLGAGQALRDATGAARRELDMRTRHDQLTAGLRGTLGEAAFAAALEEGQAMPLERAVAYAMEETL
jgi:predicted ATPase/Tfp pilus assembly protein PilF